MADEIFDSFRLSLMQDVLPVGIALVERARKKGTSGLMEVFTESKEPFKELREEGEPFAKSLRDNLDTLSPGLGNPIMSVEVSVEVGVISMEINNDDFNPKSVKRVLDKWGVDSDDDWDIEIIASSEF